MKSTLHDVYVHRDDDPELVKLYEDYFNVEQLFRMDFYHFVYLKTSGGIKFIFTSGSTEPIPRMHSDFPSRIKYLINPTFEKLCFVIANYILDGRIEEISLPVPNPAIVNVYLPSSVLELIQPTHGYLLYREQGAKFYQLATGCDDVTANNWLAGARLKKRVILDNVHKLKIDGIPSAYIDKLFPPNGGLPYLIKKPDLEAHWLQEFLQSK